MRSRIEQDILEGFYLRISLRAVLSTLEECHWNQVAARFEDSAIDLQFREIMEHAPKVQTEQKNGNSISRFPLYGHMAI